MRRKIVYFVYLILLVIFILGIIYFIKSVNKKIKYFDDSYYLYYGASDSSYVKKDDLDNIDNDFYVTVIDHTIKYTNQNITGIDYAINLIKETALNEEKKCKNDLAEEEKMLEDITGIYGINLCELEKNTALSIVNALDYVYSKYSFLKDYVTNITLVNDGGTASYIAAFKPAFTFATSNTSIKFPFIIKMQVFLNASYYLNSNYFDSVIENAINTKHFPMDTSKESLIVHEFGHVLTYVLAMKYYQTNNTLLVNKDDFKKYSSTLNNYVSNNFSKMIIKKAYDNYVVNEKRISEEEFRKNISSYANSYDNEGRFLYNETIAEAFHDYYLHNENCNKETQYIMDYLNKMIEKYI